jgi:hypothetical protein
VPASGPQGLATVWGDSWQDGAISAMRKWGLGNLKNTVAAAPRSAHIVRPNGAAIPIYLRNFAFDRVTTLWQWRAEDLC